MDNFKLPSVYSILFFLIAVVAILTWIIPAGNYQTILNETLGKEIIIAGTYINTSSNPYGLLEVLMAPIIGFYDPRSGQIRAADTAIFVLIIGGFWGVFKKTYVIDTLLTYVMEKLNGREEWIIPILMTIFAIGGTIFGMAEESLPFYLILIPAMLAARFDSVVSASIVLLGTGVGNIGSTINPFTTIIASNAAGIPFTHGIILRIILLIVCWFFCVIWVMHYAKKIRMNSSYSIINDTLKRDTYSFLNKENKQNKNEINCAFIQKIILVVFILTFSIMIYGVISLNWWMAQISTVFLLGAIIIGIIAQMSEKEIILAFINGAKDLLEVAIIIGIARSIVVIMDEGHITHTILHSVENIVTKLSDVMFINVVYWTEVILSFFIPSSSSLAIMTMPIMAPLADFANVNRDLIVTAYQSASGIVNFITPTSPVVIGGLAISRIPYFCYLKWILPLLVVLTMVIISILSIGVLL